MHKDCALTCLQANRLILKATAGKRLITKPYIGDISPTYHKIIVLLVNCQKNALVTNTWHVFSLSHMLKPCPIEPSNNHTPCNPHPACTCYGNVPCNAFFLTTIPYQQYKYNTHKLLQKTQTMNRHISPTTLPIPPPTTQTIFSI